MLRAVCAGNHHRRITAMCVLLAASSWAAAQTPSQPAPPSPAPPAATPAPPPAPPPLSDEEASYLIGVNQGEQLRRLGIAGQLSTDALARGTKEGIAGKNTTQSDGQRLQAYVRAIQEAATTRNRAAAKEFLAKNGKEKGVKTTASGLEYKVIAAGDAKAGSPKPEDQVTVQYRGKLLDGSEFDSSYAHGSPATFPVNGVIKGSKWQLFVPPELAYDAQSRPGIPGGSLLVFDVELVSVKPKPAPPAPGAGAIPGNMTSPGTTPGTMLPPSTPPAGPHLKVN